MKPEIFWIPNLEQGRLGVMTRPRGGDWLESEAEGWRDAGIQWVISLLEPDEEVQLGLTDENACAQAKNIHFVSLPIPDRGVPHSLSEARALIYGAVDALKQNQTVVLHCRQGVGRSAMMAAAILMVLGEPAPLAIQKVSQARGLAIPETSEQKEWLRDLPAGKLPEPVR